MSAPPKWFPEFPEDWDLSPIWALFRRDSRKGFAEETLLSVYREYGVIPKESRNDNNNRSSEDLSTYQLVEPGDLVVNKMKAWQGSMAISRVRGIVSPAYFIYRPTHRCDDRYLHYLLRSQPMVGSYKAESKGIRPSQWDLDPQAFAQTNVPTPPLDEQRAIADYLDRETQKIDDLIDEQRGLIETLRERRQAVIERAVLGERNESTLGVWLDGIPDHWKAIRLARLGSLVTGRTPKGGAEYYKGSGSVSWVRPGDLAGTNTKGVQISAESAVGLTVVPPGSTLVCCIGATLGKVGISKSSVATNQQITAWVHDLDAYFAYFFLVSARSQLISRAVQSTLSILNNSRLGEMLVPVPPVQEQHRIAVYLSEQTSRIDGLIAESEGLIALSQERRAALITAAVTGQIDVREKV